MNRQDSMVVFDSRGQRGFADAAPFSQPTAATSKVLVHFEGYAPVLVASDLLELQPDGSYILPWSVTELIAQEQTEVTTPVETLVIPIIEETVQVHKAQVESERLRIKKVVHEHQETVDLSLLAEEIEVRRVPINQIVAAPVAARQEGDTFIVPIYEEVVVVQKQLLLKEEVHIHKQQTEEHRPETVTLRKEEVLVERVELPGDQAQTG